jgi:hypothetical protein
LSPEVITAVWLRFAVFWDVIQHHHNTGQLGYDAASSLPKAEFFRDMMQHHHNTWQILQGYDAAS